MGGGVLEGSMEGGIEIEIGAGGISQWRVGSEGAGSRRAFALGCLVRPGAGFAFRAGSEGSDESESDESESIEVRYGRVLGGWDRDRDRDRGDESMEGGYWRSHGRMGSRSGSGPGSGGELDGTA